MKNTCLLLALISLCGYVAAANIGVDVWQDKPVYFDNETVELNLNLTNYELSTTLSDAKLRLIGSGKDITIKLGDIPPGENVFKKVSIGKFEPANYRMKAYVENTYLGVADHSDEQIIQIRVELGAPVKMLDIHSTILSITPPKEVEVNQQFEVQIKVESSVTGNLILTLDDGDAKEHTLEEGTQTITQKYTLTTAGQHNLDAKTYSDTRLMDQKTSTITAVDHEIYKKVEKGDLTQKDGKITVEGVENQDKSIITDITCFLVGGCNNDLNPPIFNTLLTNIDGGKLLFIVLLDDESRVDSCTATAKGEKIELSYDNETSGFKGVVDNAKGDGHIYLDVVCVDENGNSASQSYELFDQELCAFECCMDETCGEKEYCDTNTYTCIERKIEGCYDIMLNGDSKDKADLTFVGDGFTDQEGLTRAVNYVLGLSEESKTGIESILYGPTGLFSREPFQSNQNKFNIRAILAGDNIRYNTDNTGRKRPDYTDAITYGESCPNTDFVLTLSKEDYRSFAYFGGPSFNSIGTSLEHGDGMLICHEFGHSFGRLMDEYVEEDKGDRSGEPNCAPDEETAKKWWGDIENTGYYKGCSYINGNIRPTENSIMKWQGTPHVEYGPVNERALTKILEEYK